jgi:hypothetical protein
LEEERVAIADLADEMQIRKQRIFKLLQRLGISPTQRREPSRGNQMIATITVSEARLIRAKLEGSSEPGRPPDGRPGPQLTDDVGYFYLIQLEPRHDEGRFKVGFTVDLDGRLQKHRRSAPFAVYVKHWPCLRAWERTAIDCVTNGSDRLHTEVFRSPNLDESLSRADSFFALMPKVMVGDDESSDGDQDRDSTAKTPDE